MQSTRGKFRRNQTYDWSKIAEITKTIKRRDIIRRTGISRNHLSRDTKSAPAQN
jgi:hypothetical protein